MSENPASPPTPAKLPPLIQNWISVAGIILAACSFFAVLCLIVLDVTNGFTNPYMGILTYMIAPAFLVGGLLLISLGALLERRHRRKLAPGEIPVHPRIDLNVPRQRRAFIIVSIVTLAFLMLTAFGSYQTYHFTESVQFCGQTCHSVMEPEFTAYRNSPHANVACVQCHIGPGAGWFVKSKLSGSYQVYSVIAKKYPTPIPTPVHNLRPARDTCEQCHWPAKFYGQTVRDNRHYMADESNTVWNIKLLMKIGGGDSAHGEVGGIHWHTSANHQIEYIATDDKRLNIPWVRVKYQDGTEEIYQSETEPLTAAQVAAATPRVMDCIDCHNRPSHIYNAPSHAVNRSLAAGRLDPAIPHIKKLAVEALTAAYQTKTEALAGIAAHVPAAAVAEVQHIYSQNFFPAMKVNWRAYPNHIGHTIFPGCYRCHDGKHKTADGSKVITHDCNACHNIISQGTGPAAGPLHPQGLEFEHPVDIGDLWKEMNCAECHTGALVSQ